VLGNGDHREHLHGLNGHGEFVYQPSCDVCQPHHDEQSRRVEAADSDIADGQRKERAEVAHGSGQLS
jgi:hypothetical protein